MNLIIRILFFVLLLRKSYGLIYLNASEYERIPPVRKIDNYDSCLQEPSDVYCKLYFRLVSDEPSELLSTIQEYSKQSTTRFDHTKLTHGVCVSQRCQNYIQDDTSVSEATLEGCLNQTFWDEYRLKTKLQRYMCYNLSDYEIKIDTSDKVAGLIMLSIIVLNIISSLYDVYCTSNKRNRNSIILSFSIKRNWKNLIKTKHDDGRLENFKVFNGIRCLTAYGVILEHTILSYYVVGGNFYEIESSYNSLFYQLMINGTIMLQGVFVMAGFQLAYGIRVISEHYPLNWSIVPLAIYKRLLRLLPAYALVILLTATWMKFLGPGPFWEVGDINVTYCKTNWWMSLLFFNNYVHGPQCLASTWSIAANVQLYIFGLILMVLLRNTRFTQTILMSLVVLSSAITAIHTYIRDLDAIIIFRPKDTEEVFASDPTFNEIYRSGHGNMSSYVIGISLGYFIYEWQQKKIDSRKFSKLKVLYWSVAPMLFAIVLSGAVFYRDGPIYPAYVRAICATFNKTLVGALLAVFIAGLVMKLDRNIFRKVFEWDKWIIPSKLTYSAYLLHYPFLIMYMNMLTDLVHMTYLHMIAVSIVLTIISFVCAIPLYLLVEAPFSSILNRYKLQRKETLIKRKDSDGYMKTE